jgi:hypothetical protein
MNTGPALMKSETLGCNMVFGCAIRPSLDDREITISTSHWYDCCGFGKPIRAFLFLRRGGARDLDFS